MQHKLENGVDCHIPGVEPGSKNEGVDKFKKDNEKKHLVGAQCSASAQSIERGRGHC